MSKLSQTIAKQLLDIQAVVLSPEHPFTWSSGMKSPIYCDNRLTLSYPEVRHAVASGLSELIKTHYPEVEVVAGTATAGIPHAAWVSDILDLPMAYVRGSAKSHGKKKQIEGIVQPGQKVVIVEDLISTGGSVLTAVEALREEGAEVLGTVAIFTYALPVASENFKEINTTFHTLTDFPTLIEIAEERGMINEVQKGQLKLWYQEPTNEQWLPVVKR
ncbi:orotate phosphoribosyltransferase [Pullulanibacillus pueri]|uniref:Orotate phosphoribosyltransferase n=1 Tax=Pullulanibacillus pueri TaxID=1437324 RepID=A0A8J3EL09_9BACL|nr:orotate phosphoribosyltransferase [Pullulanibacillus pueri]MBM7680166.1 orotate phosphoribosyltransferase [Pullulanibacillus pueri]GGH74670.1 orotate phosphoribosyltransferase [Pullulanibacillus pueri]